MKRVANKTTILAAVSGLALGAGAPAMAGDMNYGDYSSVNKDGESLTQAEGTFSLEALIGGDLVNRSANLEGDITDVVFNDHGEATFIVYTHSEAAAEPGERAYANFNSVTFSPSDESFEIEANMADEAPADRPVDRRITPAEADEQLGSRLLNGSVSFATGEMYEIDDVLLTRDGKADMVLLDSDSTVGVHGETMAVPYDLLEAEGDGSFMLRDETITPDVVIGVVG